MRREVDWDGLRREQPPSPACERPLCQVTTVEVIVITLGVILLIVGFVAGVPILWSIGIVLVLVGVILELLGAAGRAVGGRRHYY